MCVCVCVYNEDTGGEMEGGVTIYYNRNVLFPIPQANISGRIPSAATVERLSISQRSVCRISE